ncbi:MAG: hypothetical protein HKN12_09260, partial [Gemmatimonadetes bacterium]|nr:hypothetical protein [Gemmatimonadota bacterium]
AEETPAAETAATDAPAEEPAAADAGAAAPPAPAAPVKKGPAMDADGNYLDDIEAMESELTSGWEEGSGEKPSPGESDSKTD